MTDIADAIALENTTLDPENALFICTNCPQKLMKDKEKLLELTEKVLNRIQMCWPMVVRNQILFLDDMEQVSFIIQLTTSLFFVFFKHYFIQYNILNRIGQQAQSILDLSHVIY